MSSHQHFTLRAVIFKDGEVWVGQCLEYDITAQAKTPQELPLELERSIVAHFMIAGTEGLRPFEHVRRAPERFWGMFERGMEIKLEPEHHAFQIKGLSEPLPVPELRLSDPVAV
jgi:hypothetical protein